MQVGSGAWEFACAARVSAWHRVASAHALAWLEWTVLCAATGSS